MSISLRNILLLGLCVSLGACAFKKEDAEEKQRQDLANDVAKQIQEGQRNSIPELNPRTVNATFEEQDIGFYIFRLTWPEGIGSVEIFINNKYETKVSGKNYFTKMIGQGETINYGFRAYATTANGGIFLGDYSNIATAPKDITVRHDESLTADTFYDINRLYFRDNSKIMTNGFRLKIKANKLIADEFRGNQSGNPAQISQIVTHYTNEPDKENPNTNNGSIEIKAGSAVGNLKIALIGRNGTDGKNGIDIAKENNQPLFAPIAEAGANGIDGKQSRFKSCAGRNKDTCQEQASTCTQQPTAGSKGKDGLKGYDATDGTAGGSTGDLIVKISDNKDFSLEIYQKAGKGGRGGLGSPGQLGGPGGQPGHRPETCSPAPAGENGTPGDKGRDGEDAVDGSIGKIDTDVKNILVFQDSK